METSQQAAVAAAATVMENGEKCQQRISPLMENGEKCQQRISPLKGGMTQPEIVSNTKIIMETSQQAAATVMENGQQRISPLMENGEKCQQRISPLRGGMTQTEIVSNTKVVRNGLHALRDDHYTILANIRDEYENQKNNSHHDTKEAEATEAAANATCTGATAASPTNGKSVGLQPTSSVLEARITNVTRSLEQLEVGIAESSVLLSLNDHFERLEADRSTLRLEMGRVQDENEWLREELNDTQKQLQEALAELAGIKEEKKQWQFQEEIRNMSEAPPSAVLRPVTPSKIPVGSWRVDEEKDINRALSGSDPGPGLAGGPRSRATSPNPSRIPVGGWRNKLSVYKRVIEKQEATTEAAKKKNATVVRKSNYFKLNAPTRAPKIPTR